MNKQELYKIAKERENELIRLTSDLIKINSENPIKSQREMMQE